MGLIKLPMKKAKGSSVDPAHEGVNPVAIGAKKELQASEPTLKVPTEKSKAAPAFIVTDAESFQAWRLARPKVARLFRNVVFRWRVSKATAPHKAGTWAAYKLDGWAADTGLSYHQVRRYFDELEKMGLIERERHQFQGGGVLAFLRPTHLGIDLAGRSEDHAKLSPVSHSDNSKNAQIDLCKNAQIDAQIVAQIDAQIDHTNKLSNEHTNMPTEDAADAAGFLGMGTSSLSPKDGVNEESEANEVNPPPMSPPPADVHYSTLLPNGVASKPDLDALESTWAAAMAKHHPQVKHVAFTAKERKLLAEVATSCVGPDWPSFTVMLDRLFALWGPATEDAKAMAGAFGLPLVPTVEFLAKYKSALLNFACQSLNNAAKKAATPSVVVQQTPSVDVIDHLDEPIPTKEELAKLLAEDD